MLFSWLRPVNCGYCVRPLALLLPLLIQLLFWIIVCVQVAS